MISLLARLLIVQAGSLLFEGCSDEAVDSDAVETDEKMVMYSSGQWVHKEGHRYDVYLDGDYLIYEKVE